MNPLLNQAEYYDAEDFYRKSETSYSLTDHVYFISMKEVVKINWTAICDVRYLGLQNYSLSSKENRPSASTRLKNHIPLKIANMLKTGSIQSTPCSSTHSASPHDFFFLILIYSCYVKNWGRKKKKVLCTFE